MRSFRRSFRARLILGAVVWITLGLAISRQLLEGWGGTIGIESGAPGGAVVRIRLRRPE